MPSLFVGHGSPENAFTNNRFNDEWKRIAASFARPKAILIISAHWTNHIDSGIHGTTLATTEHPETIHDFYGFPSYFYSYTYPAPGNPRLAKDLSSRIKTVPIAKDATWGLDHGAWSVLAQMYPEANIPVAQLSIDEDLPREKLSAIGAELAPLRDQGVLILGSGNIVHNLREIDWHGSPHPWATNFDEHIKQSLLTKDTATLIDFERHPDARRALPTAEHFLPLLFVAGASQGEDPRFFLEEIFAASLSMRCVAYGLH